MLVLFFSYFEYVGAANTVLLRGARRKTLFFILFLSVIYFVKAKTRFPSIIKKYSNIFFHQLMW
jgi:hypothetical protein